MKAYSLLVNFVFVCCVCKYTSVEIMPELKKNILNFAYRINFKYKGMLVHYFDRFCVITKFLLPSVNDLKFLPIDFNENCNYLNDNTVCDHNSKEYISNLKVYCKKIVTCSYFYKDQMSCYHCTVHNILTNKKSLILPNFQKPEKKKRSIIALQITGSIG